MEKSQRNSDFAYSLAISAFCVIAVISNVLSAKMVKLPLFQNFSIPAGLITYPLTFLISNFVSEVYGKARAQWMVWAAFGLNLLALGMIQMILFLPADTVAGQRTFESVMGLGGLRIFASLSAYMISQFVDIQLYVWIRKWTGGRWLWFRNNSSALISQMVDTAVIDMIFLYWGLGMELGSVFLIMVFSYAYKMLFTVANTPLLYLFIYLKNLKPFQKT